MAEPTPSFWRARSGWIVFVLALLIRLLALAASYSGDPPYWEDIHIARNLLSGNGYSLESSMRTHINYGIFLDQKIEHPIADGMRVTAIKTPLYPLLAAGILRLSGDRLLGLLLVNIVFSALTAALVVAILKPRSHRVAFGVGLATAFYPPFVHHVATSLESTAFTILLLFLFVFVIDRAVGRPSVGRPAVGRFGVVRREDFAVGALSGALLLTEPVVLPFVLLAWLYLASVRSARPKKWRRHWSKAGRSVLVYAVVTATVVAPWILRNLQTFDLPVLLKSPMGQNLVRGFEMSAGINILSDKQLLALEQRGRSLDESREDAALREAVLAAIREDPTVIWRAVPRHLVNFWWEVDRYREDQSLKFWIGRRIPYALLLLATGVGTLLWMRHLGQVSIRTGATLGAGRDSLKWLAMAFVLTSTVVYGVFGAWNLRFHLPTEWIMFLWVGSTFAHALSDQSQRSQERSAHSPSASQVDRAAQTDPTKSVM